MSFILHIDTATESGLICLSQNEKLLASAKNFAAQDHARWLHPAISNMLSESGVDIKELAAITITSGPGSYTGLRVAMASAKGLCFALKIPLITVNTLKFIAKATIDSVDEQLVEKSLFCPLIDARRMEVFTAIYNSQLDEVLPPQALILDEQSFVAKLDLQTVIFSGNGIAKWQQLCTHDNAVFADVIPSPQSFISLTYSKFSAGEFTAPAYAEPVYLKEFYTHPKK
ncbi:MAG: tRNA (adenosine(37)-N6)-threonylcarbamoyltransferase complex dimerization subunit type 1 TsaB [Chitinophagaceae bacterium]|nr:tRNA (adenosine(37)-N6)-threonylcarbamoyltransferase complex dimerization subunit type 1 TsaB [Chitinophagaceae bacterium]